MREFLCCLFRRERERVAVFVKNISFSVFCLNYTRTVVREMGKF